MTLTQTKRKAFPLRYAKKDARTKIYRALYGPCVGGPDPKGEPSLNETRRLGDGQDYTSARFAFEQNVLQAQLPWNKIAALEARLELLKRFKAPKV